MGGDVIYADTAAAYRSLSAPLQSMLKGMTCVTNLADGYRNIDIRSAVYAQTMLDNPPVEQPVTSTTEGNDGIPERCLNVNEAYSSQIMQLNKDESDALLPMLCRHITKPEHCVRVQYREGDIVIFDNHKLQHYAVSDYYPAPRRIFRMTFGRETLHSVEQSTRRQY